MASEEIDPRPHKYWPSVEFFKAYGQKTNRNTKVKVCSPDGDTEYFNIVAGVLQGDTLAPYLFIICLDYVLRTSIDKIRENGFELTKKQEVPRKNNFRRWLHSDTGKYTQPSQNTTA